MLHPITANRMSGSSLRNIKMMKAMCGFETYDNLLIATTMWPETPSAAGKTTLESREAELVADDRFFGALIEQGATVLRHNENGRRDDFGETASAQRLVAHLIRQSDAHTLDVLRLQQEIIDERKALGETAAGIAVAGELYKARRAHERQLRAIKKETEGQLAKVDARHAAELEELKADVEKQLRKAEEEKQALTKSMKEMHANEEKAWSEKIEAVGKQFREHLAAKEEELRDMEESLSEIRKDVARRAKNHCRNQDIAGEVAVYEKVVKDTRKEVEQARGAYQKFSGRTSNLLNGISNGVAAGAVSGVIAAGKPSPRLFRGQN